jgi:putative alpha-1,2-mannosidase
MRILIRLRLSLVLLFFLPILPVLAQSASSPYDAVDPFIGTTGGGNTFPGATLPFGMIQWSPDTGREGWYFYPGREITGFSLTHISGAGCPLYGDFAVLPTTPNSRPAPAQASHPTPSPSTTATKKPTPAITLSR